VTLLALAAIAVLILALPGLVERSRPTRRPAYKTPGPSELVRLEQLLQLEAERKARVARIHQLYVA
jgi:hypothetical protein